MSLTPRGMQPLNKDIIDSHLLEVFRNLRSSINFDGLTDIQTVIFKEPFSFINFAFVTQKRKNESALIELVTRS